MNMLGAPKYTVNKEITKKLSEESKKLKRDFNLAQSANVDLEKKVAELADALKRCQDEKKIAEDGQKIAEEALESSKKRISKSFRKLTMMT
jgi:predicted  nucleic acid-binding Zn-ribbon protein